MMRGIFILFMLWWAGIPALQAEGVTDEWFSFARDGDLDGMEELLGDQEVPDMVDESSGLTLWQMASLHGRKEMADLLEQCGADPRYPFPPLDQILAMPELEGQASPGFVLHIQRGEEVLLSRGYGMADLDEGRALESDSILKIGSITKTMTSTAVLRLVEDGKLTLDDTIDRWFPDFPRGDLITIEHLLQHRSGIRNYTALSAYGEKALEERSPADLISLFRDEEPDFAPGEGWNYCNSGYFLLSQIISLESEMSWSDALKHLVLEPAGMQDTCTFSVDETPSGRHALGYAFETEEDGEGEWEIADAWHPSQIHGAGDLESTAADLVNFLKAWSDGRLIREELVEAALETGNSGDGEREDGLGGDYGLGWVVSNHRGLRKLGHNGGLPGFQSRMSYYPDQDVYIVFLCNALPSGPEIQQGQILKLVEQAVLWREMEPLPSFRSDQLPEREVLETLTGTYDFMALGIMRFRIQDGHLEGRLAAQSWAPLQAAGEDRFENSALEAVFTFERNDEGVVNAVTLEQRGMTIRGLKFQLPERGEVSEKTLNQLVGEYDFGALGTMVMKPHPKGNGLLGRLSKQPEMTYFPMKERPGSFFSPVIRAILEFAPAEGAVEKDRLMIHQSGMTTTGVRAEKDSTE